MGISRRAFLGSTAATVAVTGAEPASAVPTRALGKTGVEVSALAYGCGTSWSAYGSFEEALATWNSPDGNPYVYDLFKPKGQVALEPMVVQSAYGPIGLPADQAVYPGIIAADGQPLNASKDYVVRMSKEQMPPAKAFWSVTLYDSKNGFLIPNERKKYSVGENAGFKLDENGGIEIHIAADQPEGVPEENWLPIVRGDEALDVVMRLYAPDLEKMKTWTPPKAEMVKAK